jgi:hypothetical protein
MSQNLESHSRQATNTHLNKKRRHTQDLAAETAHGQFVQWDQGQFAGHRSRNRRAVSGRVQLGGQIGVCFCVSAQRTVTCTNGAGGWICRL